MQAEEGAGWVGLTCVWCAITVGVSCYLALLKALMRPVIVVEASVAQDVVAAQRSLMCWTANCRGLRGEGSLRCILHS